MHDAGNQHGREQDLECAEFRDRCENDGRQPGGGAADARMGTADGADDDAADNAGNNPGKQRRARGEGNAETQGQGDEEYNYAGRQIVLEGMRLHGNLTEERWLSVRMRICFAHGDITIGIGLLPMNRIHERLIGINQTGAMHRFDAFSGRRVKTTGKKYNTQFANASSLCARTLQFFRPKKDLDKSGFIPFIFIALNNSGLGF